MNKVKIFVMVAGNREVEVEGYQSPVRGLVLHRQIVYIHDAEEHKTGSKWQITHEPTGKAVLEHGECVETLAMAKSVAMALADYDWTTATPPVHSRPAIKKALKNRHVEEEVEEPPLRRYVVRRNPEGAGHVIWDLEEDKIYEEVLHRGLASQRCEELNGNTVKSTEPIEVNVESP